MAVIDTREKSDIVNKQRHIYIRPGVYKLDDSSRIEVPSAPVGGFDCPSSPIQFGAYSYSWSTMSRFVSSVGRYCSIAGSVTFGDDEHPINNLTTSIIMWDKEFVFGPYSRDKGKTLNVYTHDWSPHNKQIQIGHDVWIGGRTYIRRGVVLGDGCVVGSNAVVTRSVPPYAVVVGNPARVVKTRFPEPLVELLLKTKWWRFDHNDFVDINMRDPERACERVLEMEAAGRLVEFSPETVTGAELSQIYSKSE